MSYVDADRSSYVLDASGDAGRGAADGDTAPILVREFEEAPAALEQASVALEAREPEPEAAADNPEGVAHGPAFDGDVAETHVDRAKRRTAFEDVEPPDPYPAAQRGRRGFMIAIAVLSMIALAMAAYLIMTGVLGSGIERRAEAGVGAAAGSAATELISAVANQGTAARDEALEGGWLSTKTVCIDAGHGARADLTLTPIGPGSSEMQYVEPGGASGVATGRGEYEVVLEVALLLQEKLADAGVNVVMVRTTNDVVMSSEERAVIANECGADLFVRLHADGADDSSVKGFSTLVPGLNQWTEGIVESSAYAAQVIHPIVIEKTGANDRGIVERSDLAGFNFCEVPSILMEMGYMSNPEEDRLLSDPEYQELLASAICDGVIAYLEAVS